MSPVLIVLAGSIALGVTVAYTATRITDHVLDRLYTKGPTP